ncbi:hypothetical protein MHYP_G00233980 [Metynnis hypsauchen]
MSPAEQPWGVVETSIHSQDPAPTNTMELWVAVQTAWLNIPPDVFCPLVASMPHHFQQSCMPSCAEHTTRASAMIGASAPRAKNYKRPECECWNGPVSLHSSQSDHKRPRRTVSVQAAGKE